MTLEVVPADPQDAPILSRLHGACFEAAWREETFRGLLGQPGVFALLGSADGQSVGFVLARVVVDEAEILSIGVLPSRQSRGIGRQMMQSAARTAFERGATRLFLEAGADNRPALALYASLGFREIGRRRGYYGERQADGLTMRADLPLGRLGKPAELD